MSSDNGAWASPSAFSAQLREPRRGGEMPNDPIAHALAGWPVASGYNPEAQSSMASASDLSASGPATPGSVLSSASARAGWPEQASSKREAVEDGKPVLFIPQTLLVPLLPEPMALEASEAVLAPTPVKRTLTPPVTPAVGSTPASLAAPTSMSALGSVDESASIATTRAGRRESTLEVEVDEEFVEVDDEAELAGSAALSTTRSRDEVHEVNDNDLNDLDEAEEVAIVEPPLLIQAVPRRSTTEPIAPPAALDSRPIPPPPPAKPAREAKRPWYIDFFAMGGAAVSSLAGRREAAKDVDFVHACLGEPERATLLDVCCGDGRHCFEFAGKGYDVTGYELSDAQLRRAGERNSGRALPIPFVEGDWRTLALGRTFDVITCLGSSLGYIDEESDRLVLQRLREHLTKAGRLVVQVFNRDYMVSNVPCRSWWSSEGALVLDEVDFDFAHEQLRVHRTMLGEDGQQHEHFIAMRAYSLHELSRLVTAAGFRVLEVSGARTTRGYFFGASSPDIWLIAENRG